MADVELTPTSYAVLGMVGLRGPSTAYEIKRALGHLAGEFWAVPHVQHYREAQRLEAAGLLRAAEERTGRRRRTYSLTPSGRQALRRWLADPVAGTMEIRDEGELKLFFAELAPPGAVAALAEAQAEAYRRRLRALAQLEARFAEDPSRAPRLGPARMGRAVYRAALRFWEGVAGA